MEVRKGHERKTQYALHTFYGKTACFARGKFERFRNRILHMFSHQHNKRASTQRQLLVVHFCFFRLPQRLSKSLKIVKVLCSIRIGEAGLLPEASGKKPVNWGCASPFPAEGHLYDNAVSPHSHSCGRPPIKPNTLSSTISLVYLIDNHPISVSLITSL